MHVTEQPKNMREEKSPIIPRHCGRILPENQSHFVCSYGTSPRQTGWEIMIFWFTSGEESHNHLKHQEQGILDCIKGD